MNFPKYCLVDTNVAITANLATQSDNDSTTPVDCVAACVEAIAHVTDNNGLIVDANGEILTEYRNNLAMHEQGMGITL